MSLYKEFSELLPYIQSVRKIEKYLSFDISFPTSWKLPKKYVQEDKVMEQENKIAGNRTFSFVAEINESDVEQVTENLQNIIKYNLEREEKDRLFQNKVDELKTIFNPFTQAKEHDPKCEYIKTWITELKDVDNDIILNLKQY